MDLQLNGKTAVVTGGSRGIGKAIVEALLAEGCRVAIVDRAPPTDASLLNSDDVSVFPTELTDEDSITESLRQLIDRLGAPDVLVNNAGVNDSVALGANVSDFMQSLSKNLVHYFVMVSGLFESLKRSDVGSIVNIGSKVSVTGQGSTSAYAAAKGGVNALTREWAVAGAPYGVRANAVIPAEVWTPMYGQWLETTADPAAERQSIESSIPLGHRFTTSEEIAATAVFLASPKSSHTTGQLVFVDGGYTHLDRRYRKPD